MNLPPPTRSLPSFAILSAARRRKALSVASSPQRPHSLAQHTSFLLDLIRFAAAVLVVAAHLTHLEFPTGFRERQILGDIAVPIFFVLSGFVIRFITRSRSYTLRDFFIDRAARMYSVILPAMALTLAITGFCLLTNPVYLHAHWGAFTTHPVARVVLNLTFLSQSWGRSTIPLINSPFWSLSYECLFYIGYGLFFYLRGWRRLTALTLWALVAGPQVLFLLPVWALGCALYEVYFRLRRTRAANSLLAATLGYLTLATLLFVLGHHRLLEAPLRAYQAAVALPNPLPLLHLSVGRATMMAVATGIVAAFSLLLLALLADLLPEARGNPLPARFRPIADGTFSIYLMHYPLLVLAGSLTLLRPYHLLLNLTTATLIVGLLVLAAIPCDRFKLSIRHRLNLLATQPRGVPMAAFQRPTPASGRLPPSVPAG